MWNPEREARDAATRAEHEHAVAAGESRTLRRAKTGELHSYASDEVPIALKAGGPSVISWWGMSILALFAASMTVFSVVLFVASIRSGEPVWSTLLLILLASLFTIYATYLARREWVARKLRRQRGVPDPGSSLH